ncbi:hypothetical protein X777_00332 [Ooceraea biroi]|uniref:Uncharacterized protein n=1 Tax=Ooceraea biroi TaxID=2015173 RepID=A0A026WWI6_OOCBI|nr:hypothetical protein X777_00332 [Ooceraea biroi]
MHTASSYLPVHVVRPALKLFDGSSSSPSPSLSSSLLPSPSLPSPPLPLPLPQSPPLFLLVLATLPVISDAD